MFRFLVSLGSFQVIGIPTQSDKTPPVLIQPVSLNNLKLLQAEFEINPLDKTSGYRLQVLAQSLEIKYNSVMIEIKLNLDYISLPSRQSINLWNVLKKILDIIYKGKIDSERLILNDCL